MFTFIFARILKMFEIVQIWNIKHGGKDRIRILNKNSHHDSCFIVDQWCENRHFNFCFSWWEREKIFTYIPTAVVIDTHIQLYEAAQYLAICKKCMYNKCCRTCGEVVYLPEIVLGNTPIRKKTSRSYLQHLHNRDVNIFIHQSIAFPNDSLHMLFSWIQ